MQPTLRHGIGRLIAEWDEQGGLFLGRSDAAEPTYTLKVAGLSGATEGVASSGPDPERCCEAVCVSVMRLDLVPDCPIVPPEWAGLASQLVCFDATLRLEIDLDDDVCFELHGDRWWSRNLGKLEVKELCVTVACRCFLNASAKVVKVAITGTPDVQWDIELSLLAFGLPLPDAVEDGWLAQAVARKLEDYTVERPWTCELGGASKGTVSRLLDLGLAAQHGASAEPGVPDAVAYASPFSPRSPPISPSREPAQL